MHAFATELAQRLSGRHLLKHPFYEAWTAGTLSKETLGFYARQYYRQVLAFPRYVSAVHAACDDKQGRKVLLENLVAEERGERNHPELWLRFAESLGVARADVEREEMLPETRAMVETFMSLTRDGSYASGLGALYAYEHQVPAVAQSKIDGLKKFYGITEKRGLDFFEEHVTADVWHSEEEAALMEKLSPAEKEEAAAAARRAMDALWGFLDGVQRTCMAEAA